jgi:uncharacterized LabA/DUF88 family protein
MPERAVLFIDGNNWYHGLKEIDVGDLGRLDYRKISEKLVGPRDWTGTRYYIGRVRQTGAARLYSSQRRFLSQLTFTDRRITTHLGRLETRPFKNPAAQELRRYLGQLHTRIDSSVYSDLMSLARRHSDSVVTVEKAVDVMLAIDMAVMAERDEYDAAYLLSADGDFTPAAEAAKSHGKKVYAVSPLYGAQLAAIADSFIRLRHGWFDDCYC